ncbi:GNAT family N-acetyltransferase [Phenylobacterium sp. 58.2.17]|uniref:GNAT family N-acetyltransferase n=1 Tax=Phenylobacterium sp. 58.2.17 TaxID=2969306 RepID=UPI002265371A|nr:GNAT family N-acetyltransferase [Phenylobacterium sp. 58.2.17]MCX7587801.1 GNAT family N-acetyltransferase [Phenylobacterium sp. 58.2.17]
MLVVCELTSADATPEAAKQVSDLMTLLAGACRSIAPADLRTVIETNHLFAAQDEGAIVGLVCLVPMHLPQGTRLWIESVILDPAYRGAGAGRTLMEAALSKAKEYGDAPVSLTSNPTRVIAHQLFEQLGFRRADTSVFRL